MKFGALVREAFADVVSGTTRAGTLAAVLAGLVGGVLLVDAVGTRNLVEAARDFRAAGAATFVLTATGAVDPIACEALSGIEGVTAAGALRESATGAVLSVLPASPVVVWETSPRFAAVLGVEDAGDGALVARDVVDATGVARDEWIATTAGPLFVDSVFDYPADGRRVGFGWAALRPLGDREPFDECWVSTWPYDEAIRQLLPSVVDLDAVADPSFSYEVVQLNERLGTRPPGVRMLASRASASAPIVVTVLGGTVGALAVHTRRRELASRLHHASRRTTVAALAVIETSFWAGCGSGLACIGVVVVGLLVPPEDGHAIVVTGGLMAAIGAASAILGALARALLIRERDLFRYFREG